MDRLAEEINVDEAASFMQTIKDPVVRNLVQLGVGKARIKFVRRIEQTPAQWRSELPQADWDALFYARVLNAIFSELDIVRRVIDGQSLPEASGWDV